jgi:hypothetical protein
MPRHLTTAQVARALGLAASTSRHYRSEGRIVPSTQTPGGHARYDLDEVVEALGSDVVDPPAAQGAASAVAERRREIKGLVAESFAPLGQHDVRSSGRSGALSAQIVALGVRETPEHPSVEASRPTASRPRWGGTLLNARRTAVA